MQVKASTMEGVLSYKWKSGKLRRWNRGFFVLRGPFLYLYASEDKAQQAPNKEKELITLKGCTTSVVPHHERHHCFELVHPERRGIVLDAPSAQALDAWIGAIASAAQGPVNAPLVKLKLYYDCLGLQPRPGAHGGDGISVDDIRAAFREAYVRAKEHEAVEEVEGEGDGRYTRLCGVLTEAHEVLIALKEAEAEEDASFKRWAVSLPRGGSLDGAWLGLRFVQRGAPPLARVVVGAINELPGVVPGSHADTLGVREGDILVEIGGKGVRGAGLEELVPWMRPPKKATRANTKLVFLRRKDGVYDPAEDDGHEHGEDEASHGAQSGAGSHEDDMQAPIILMGELEQKWLDVGRRRKWQQRYFVLRGAFIYAYENAVTFRQATASGGQLGLLGVFPVKDSTTQIVDHRTKLHCFEVLHEERRGAMFCALNEEDKYHWIRAIAAASLGPVNAPVTVAQYYHTLGLGERYDASLDKSSGSVDPPDLNDIKRAYRKAALRSHPDKGGNMDLFKAVTEAYEVLQAVLETENEEAEHFDEVQVTIERDGLGLGIGMQQKGTPPLIRVIVDEIIADGPADRGGQLQCQDILVEVNGAGVRGLTFEAICEHLKLAARSPITELMFLRRHADAPAEAGSAWDETRMRRNSSRADGMNDYVPPTPYTYEPDESEAQNESAGNGLNRRHSGRQSRRNSFFQQVQDELGPADCTPAPPRPATPTATSSRGRRMSWVQRSEMFGDHDSEEESTDPQMFTTLPPAAVLPDPVDDSHATDAVDPALGAHPSELRAALGLPAVHAAPAPDAPLNIAVAIPISTPARGRRMSWIERAEAAEHTPASFVATRRASAARRRSMLEAGFEVDVGSTDEDEENDEGAPAVGRYADPALVQPASSREEWEQQQQQRLDSNGGSMVKPPRRTSFFEQVELEASRAAAEKVAQALELKSPQRGAGFPSSHDQTSSPKHVEFAPTTHSEPLNAVTDELFQRLDANLAALEALEVTQQGKSDPWATPSSLNGGSPLLLRRSLARIESELLAVRADADAAFARQKAHHAAEAVREAAAALSAATSATGDDWQEASALQRNVAVEGAQLEMHRVFDQVSQRCAMLDERVNLFHDAATTASDSFAYPSTPTSFSGGNAPGAGVRTADALREQATRDARAAVQAEAEAAARAAQAQAEARLAAAGSQEELARQERERAEREQVAARSTLQRNHTLSVVRSGRRTSIGSAAWLQAAQEKREADARRKQQQQQMETYPFEQEGFGDHQHHGADLSLAELHVAPGSDVGAAPPHASANRGWSQQPRQHESLPPARTMAPPLPPSRSAQASSSTANQAPQMPSASPPAHLRGDAALDWVVAQAEEEERQENALREAEARMASPSLAQQGSSGDAFVVRPAARAVRTSPKRGSPFPAKPSRPTPALARRAAAQQGNVGVAGKPRRRMSLDSRAALGFGANDGRQSAPSPRKGTAPIAAPKTLQATVAFASAQSPQTGQVASNLVALPGTGVGRGDWVAPYSTGVTQHWVVFDLGRRYVAPKLCCAAALGLLCPRSCLFCNCCREKVSAITLDLWGTEGNPRLCKIECAQAREGAKETPHVMDFMAENHLDAPSTPDIRMAAQTAAARLRIGPWEHVASFTVPSAEVLPASACARAPLVHHLISHCKPLCR